MPPVVYAILSALGALFRTQCSLRVENAERARRVPIEVDPDRAEHATARAREYGAHFHHERNHQGIDNQLVRPLASSTDRKGRLVRRSRLGGLLNYYERAAA
jgi:hypothetical protein